MDETRADPDAAQPEARKREQRPLRPFAPEGHFYSPVGDRAEVRAYYASDHYRAQCARVDAMLDHAAMLALWPQLAAAMVALPMTKTPGFRYHGMNNQLTYADASLLSAMIRWIDPVRIVEIGSGWSSAVVFDTLERTPGARLTDFLTIDPDQSRILALDPPAHARRIAAPVQAVGLAPFQALEAGDVLFIDSSHVLKTGSDVHFEYLHILPALKPGVFVHVHDIFYPFEYPRGWAVQENRSWNEIYLVDMLLTHGTGFEVVFFNDAFLKRNGSDLAAAGEPMLQRFAAVPTRPMHALAGSIWLRRR